MSSTPDEVVQAVMKALGCERLTDSGYTSIAHCGKHLLGWSNSTQRCPEAQRTADAAFAASLEWAAASMLHTCTCHPSDDDSAHCVSPVARQLRYWARGES